MKDRVDLIVIINTSPLGNILRILKRSMKSLFFKQKRNKQDLNIHGANSINIGFLIRTLTWKKRQLPRILENIATSSLQSKTLEITSVENGFELISHTIKLKNLS